MYAVYVYNFITLYAMVYETVFIFVYGNYVRANGAFNHPFQARYKELLFGDDRFEYLCFLLLFECCSESLSIRPSI